MSRFRFELAGPGDDADLRHVLAATPMEGAIEVSFRREPSWFGAAVVDGRRRQVVACRDCDTGRIIGFGCRSLRDVFVNDRPATIGYLSSLRVLPEYRNIGLVARGYAFFRRLHQEDGYKTTSVGQDNGSVIAPVPLYLTTIAEGNETALRVLTGARAGLPRYHPAGKYVTLVLYLRRPMKPIAPPPGFVVRGAHEADLPALVDFLTAVGPRRQFFPRYCAEDFQGPDGLLRGLPMENVVLAERGGRIVGTLAGWDQFSYRQSVVHSYRGWLRWSRPLINLGALLGWGCRLPTPGQSFRYLTAALPVVTDDDPEVFAGLLAYLHARHGNGPCSQMLLGLHQDDPLLAVVEKLAYTCYTTNLYLVCWQADEASLLLLDSRPPYLELGSL